MVEIFDDIRKLYQFESPCSELAEYIEFFSETSLVATDRYITTEKFSVRLFPSYTPTVWINLGAPYHLKNGNNYHLIGTQTDILLLRNEIVERVNLPTDNVFTIKFFPGGLEAVFGISQTSIGSDIVDAAHIIPLPVIQKLKRSGSFKDRVSLLQNFFLGKLEKRCSPEHYLKLVKRAIDAFCLSGMEASNTELAKQTYLSDKTLYRYFMKAIGTSPKNYFATVRARTALTAFVTDTNSFSPYEYGYYDMSHFYKDVARFTGQKLSFYRS
jgi:AraC-like DNA-binding protein